MDGLRYIDVTPVLDTNAYTANDTLFDKTEIPNAAKGFGEPVELVSLAVIDKDDQTAAAVDLYFLSSDVTFGAANSAPSISDTDAVHLLGCVSLAAGDWKDVGGAKVATKTAIGMILKPKEGTKSVYVAATCAGTPTQTASGYRLRFGFRDAR